MTDGETGAAAGDRVFDLSGGALCLDLVNTVDGRPTEHPQDRLPDYASLAAWGVQARVIAPAEAARLTRMASREAGRGRKALARAVKAREAIFEIFRAEAAGLNPPAEAISALEALLPDAYARIELVRGPDGYEPGWQGGSELDGVLWPALRSALELLTSPDLRLVRLCASETCDWLFLDRSRNRSRRWCDMKVCGNRHKVREHYRRTRDAG